MKMWQIVSLTNFLPGPNHIEEIVGVGAKCKQVGEEALAPLNARRVEEAAKFLPGCPDERDAPGFLFVSAPGFAADGDGSV